MRIASLIFTGVLMLCLAIPAPASMDPEVDLAWLTEKSIDIVSGEIVDQRVEVRNDIPGFKELVITVYTVRVSHTIKGGLIANAFTDFAVLGGEAGGKTFRASDMPEGLAVGMKGIFFLRDWNGLRVPSGWEFGCAVQNGTKVRTLGQEFEKSALEADIRALLTPKD
jgi:hypothetical protein